MLIRHQQFFSKTSYNNPNLLKTSYQSDVEENFHPLGTTYRANVFHEFGHYIESVADINPKKLAKSIFQKQNHRYFSRQMCDDWIMKGLSTYALVFDYRDYISECFAEFFESKSPRSIAIDTINEVLKLLSEKGLM